MSLRYWWQHFFKWPHISLKILCDNVADMDDGDLRGTKLPVSKCTTVAIWFLELTEMILSEDFNPKYLTKAKVGDGKHNTCLIVTTSCLTQHYILEKKLRSSAA